MHVNPEIDPGTYKELRICFGYKVKSCWNNHDMAHGISMNIRYS